MWLLLCGLLKVRHIGPFVTIEVELHLKSTFEVTNFSKLFQMPIYLTPSLFTFFFSWKADIKHFHLNISKILLCHWNSSKNDNEMQQEVLQ